MFTKMLLSQRLNLIDLPVDIHKLIIQELKVKEPLFVPQYGQNAAGHDVGYCGDLAEKSKDYYGDWTDNDKACVTGLLNWSMTCQYFHELIVPDLYKTVVLRPKERSVRSIRCLSQSPHWSRVANLIFAGTWETDADEDFSEDWQEATDKEFEAILESQKKRSAQVEDLVPILSRLPPNLESLILDFPQGWEVEGYDYENLGDNGFYNTGGDGEGHLRQLETTDRYRDQLETVFIAIGTDANIDSLYCKSSFKLRLLNITPLETTAYSSKQFRNFLKQVTELEIGLGCYKMEDGYYMNTMSVPSRFGKKLSNLFFNHLENCTDLIIRADSTWPLGLAPGQCHIDLPLPKTAEKLPKVERIRFFHCFIDPTIIAFLRSHLSTLTSITFTDCYANGTHSGSDVNDAPMWRDLFSSLVTATDPSASRLTYISVANPSNELNDLIEGYYGVETSEGEREQIHDYLNQERVEELKQCQKEGRRSPTDEMKRRRKSVYSHAMLNSECGTIFQDQDRNFERFSTGTDHAAWLQLVGLVEENMKKLESDKKISVWSTKDDVEQLSDKER